MSTIRCLASHGTASTHMCAYYGQHDSKNSYQASHRGSSSSRSSSTSSTSMSSSDSSSIGIDVATAFGELGCTRSKAFDKFDTPYGRILYCQYPNRRFFVAVCTNEQHRRRSGALCRLTKSSCKHTSRKRAAQGRPLAHLYLWLKACDCELKDGKHDCKVGYAERKKAREELMSMPGFEAFSLLYERELRDSEGLEPLQDVP